MTERTYTLFLHDGSATPPLFELCICDSPQAASKLALKLLDEHPRYHAVEVSDALTSFMVERPDAKTARPEYS